MKKLLILIVFSCLTVCIFAHNKDALAKSDSLFAEGVDLYNKRKFKEAIPFFTESDSIDKAELDSASNRRDYSAMWLACCYYNIGDTIKAKELCPLYYSVKPVDRRFTVESDSLYSLGTQCCKTGYYLEAIRLVTEAMNIEEQILGKEHPNYATALSNLANYNYYLGNYVEAIRLGTEALNIRERVLGKEHPDYALSLSNLADYNHSLGNYAEAIRLETESLNIVERVLGKEHPDYAESLNNLVLYNYYLGNYAEAIQLGTDALNICERVLGKEHPDYATSLSNLAYCNASLGNYAEAIRLGTEALNIVERVLGKEHPDYALSLNNLALYNYYLGNYAEAIRLGTEALNIRERVLGKEHPDYALSLNNLALYNNSLGNYAEAIRLGTEALNIVERVLGKEHPDYATSLSNLANYNASLGDYAEAIQLGTDALNIRERVLGKGHPDYATSLSSLALYNNYLGNYAEAIRLGTDALNIVERVLGKEHPGYATALSILAGYNHSLGNYAEAIRLETEALNIAERVLGKEHPDYATSLSILAGYNHSLGNYAEAIRLGTDALNIVERVLGKEYPAYALSLNNLALYNNSLGNYAEAIRLGTDALNIVERVLGKEHPDYATSLGNLANYNASLGNYAEAIRLGTEVLNIVERVLGKEHPDYATSLSSLALYNHSLDNYVEAIRLGTDALNIRERVLGKEHPDYALSLNNLAFYNNYLGNYAEAIRLGTEALNIAERVLGKEHPDYALSLNNLALYNNSLGNYAEAIRLGTDALNIVERVLGKEHPRVINITKNLSEFCFKNNDYQNAERYLIDANKDYKNYVRSTFANLTSAERSLFWDVHKSWFEGIVNGYAFYTNTPQIIGEAYNMTLLAKGILLNSERDFSTLIMESRDEISIETFGKLKGTRNLLNVLYEKPISERFLNTDSLETVAQHLERELISRSKIYGDFTRNMTINWIDVRQKLQPKDVAIEFVSFPVNNDSVIYAAYILDSKMKNPELVSLFEARELSRIPIANYYTTADLSRLVWGKIDGFINNAENIYFAPAGELYNIAIESLPNYKSEGLLSERYNFYRLSSTRELAVIKNNKNIEKAALYGGLKYETDVDVLEKDARRYPTAAERNLSFINLADSLNLRNGVGELPATKIEVENINKLFNPVEVELFCYTDTLGTEASFKALSDQKINIIHIATHGFYWTQKEARRMQNNLRFLDVSNNKSNRYVEDKALTRSGLLFAGANNALSGKPIPENIQDGILTAQEISVLNLDGLDMVVMSACQTGLGEITGDGVFGLQRGFKKAGAGTMLMSLWKVDDRATQILMTEFYENFLSGKSKHESLMLAQKYLREYEEEVEMSDDSNMTASQRRRNQRLGEDVKNNTVEKVITRPFANPKYWAAFILLDALD